MRFYLGPKVLDELKASRSVAHEPIDFGMFAVLAGRFRGQVDQAFVGNYGWSIVLLTVLINVLMFPLRHKHGVDAEDAGAAAADEGDPGALQEPKITDPDARR